MKDGRTRLAHKAEHAVDLETGAVVGIRVQDAAAGDTQTLLETLVTAAEQVDAVLPTGPGITELVLDKVYHSNLTLVTMAQVGIRSYVSEPDRGRRNWRSKHSARDAVYGNRRRIRGARGKRRRGERLERPNAHLYATGRLGRVHLRGHGNILKRLLLQVCGLNLGLFMRQTLGVGTPRGLQGRACALADALLLTFRRLWRRIARTAAGIPVNQATPSLLRPTTLAHSHILPRLHEGSFATAC